MTNKWKVYPQNQEYRDDSIFVYCSVMQQQVLQYPPFPVLNSRVLKGITERCIFRGYSMMVDLYIILMRITFVTSLISPSVLTLKTNEPEPKLIFCFHQRTWFKLGDPSSLGMLLVFAVCAALWLTAYTCCCKGEGRLLCPVLYRCSESFWNACKNVGCILYYGM